MKTPELKNLRLQYSCSRNKNNTVLMQEINFSTYCKYCIYMQRISVSFYLFSYISVSNYSTVGIHGQQLFYQYWHIKGRLLKQLSSFHFSGKIKLISRQFSTTPIFQGRVIFLNLTLKPARPTQKHPLHFKYTFRTESP